MDCKCSEGELECYELHIKALEEMDSYQRKCCRYCKCHVEDIDRCECCGVFVSDPVNYGYGLLCDSCLSLAKFDLIDFP